MRNVAFKKLEIDINCHRSGSDDHHGNRNDMSINIEDACIEMLIYIACIEMLIYIYTVMDIQRPFIKLP